MKTRTAAAAFSRWLRLTGVAFVVVLSVFVSNVTPVQAFDPGTLGAAAGAATSIAAAGTATGATGLTMTGAGATAAGAVTACAASVVCGVAVVGGVLLVGGIAYLAFSDSGGPVAAARYTDWWSFEGQPQIQEMGGVCTGTVTATWPSTYDEAPFYGFRVSWHYGNGWTTTGLSNQISGYPMNAQLYDARDADGTCSQLLGVEVKTANPFSSPDERTLVACWGSIACDAPEKSDWTYVDDIPEPSDVPRQIITTGTCVAPDGSRSDALPWFSRTYTDGGPQAPAVRPPLCPPGTSPAQIDVVTRTPGVADRTVISVTSPPDMQPGEVCGPTPAGYPCALVLQRAVASDWLICNVGGVGCADAWPTPDPSTFRCALVVAATSALVSVKSLSDCAVLQPAPSGTVAPTPDSEQGDPGTYGTRPPVTQPSDCAPSGWNLLNPLAYVSGTACVLTWAFVPTPGALGMVYEEARIAFTSSGPGQLATELGLFFTSFTDAYSDAGTCSVSDEASTGYELHDTWVGLPCDNPLGSAYVPVYVILQGALFVSTFFVLWRIAHAAFSGTGDE